MSAEKGRKQFVPGRCRNYKYYFFTVVHARTKALRITLKVWGIDESNNRVIHNLAIEIKLMLNCRRIQNVDEVLPLIRK